MINQKSFYDNIRPLFGERILLKQFNGMQVILSHWEQSGLTDIRWLAYGLGTAFLETAYTMQPVKEYGGNSYFIKRYFSNKKIRKQLGNLTTSDAVNFCGRGFVQITGRSNYKKMGERLGVDLINRPELAQEPDIAVKIMFEGMVYGLFTGKKLDNYFSETNEDWINARRIINSLDKATTISEYAKKFYHSLK